MPKAILTGASSGIGEALARELAGQGYHLGLMARRGDRLEALRTSLAVPVQIQTSDFLNPDSALADFQKLWDALGGAELVILNAGVNHANDGLDWAQDRAMIAVNLSSFTALADEAGRRFLKAGAGHLVGISSIAAVRGSGKAPVYGATKAFLVNFLQGLRQRLRAECPRIRVTDIRPGYVDTAMIEQAPFKIWAAAPAKAARQIMAAVHAGKKQVYITRRWHAVACLYKLLPEPLLHWIYARCIRKR